MTEEVSSIATQPARGKSSSGDHYRGGVCMWKRSLGSSFDVLLGSFPKRPVGSRMLDPSRVQSLRARLMPFLP